MASPVKFPELRAEREPRSVNIGDLVQWTSGGVDQFETPRRVRDIRRLHGEDWALVEGTKTGMPVSELTVVTPKADTEPQPSLAAAADQVATPSPNGEREYLRGLLSRDASYRLLVSGDIGPKELGKMIKLLQAQKAILEDDPDREERDDF